MLNGHTDSVTSVAFSTDGMRIVSGSEDKSMRIWDMSMGKELNVLDGHTSLVNSVAFSTDGMRIVSSSRDNSVRVWDASTGKQLKVLKGSTFCVNSVAFSTDSTRIVSGSEDKSVRVWNASTGKELNVLNGHTDSVNSVTFSTDGTHTVSGSSDDSVRVWKSMEPNYIREQAKNPPHGQPHTGWLLSADAQAHLMFVPLDARLPDPSNILTIPPSAVSSVDFTNATIGSRWHDCYSP